MKSRPHVRVRRAGPQMRPEASVEIDEQAAEIVSENDRPHGLLRRLIWLFFWLLLIEGALRKWIFPQWSTHLLLIRDPVVILIYLVALAQGVFPVGKFIVVSFLLGIASAVASMFTGQDNLLVTLYGLRTSFLYLPFIFLLPKILDERDVSRFGRALLISAIPMSLLVLEQFRASPGAWVNVGVSGEQGAQLTVGFNKIRPPGTFSFTSGLGCYLVLVVAFLFSWMIKRDSTSRRIVFAAIPATALMIAVSGSRGLLSSVALIIVGMGYVCIRKPMFLGKGVRAAFLLGMLFFVLQFRHEVRQGMMIFEDRITTGGGVRNGLIVRTLSNFTEPFAAVRDTPLLGEGIGLGTTVAGGLLYGERKFLLAEGEWTRIVRESGPILGFAYLALRVAFVVMLFHVANRVLKEEHPLPMLLAAATFPIVLNGQWGVSTLLGFATFSAGLCLAAARVRTASTAPRPFTISPESVTNPTRTVRGRSIYAEKLHGR